MVDESIALPNRFGSGKTVVLDIIIDNLVDTMRMPG
jgi:hypothetical protein